MGIIVILIATIVISILTSVLIITFIDRDKIEAALLKNIAEQEDSDSITAAKNGALKASKKNHIKDGMVCRKTPLTEPLLLIGDSRISH